MFGVGLSQEMFHNNVFIGSKSHIILEKRDKSLQDRVHNS